MYGWIPTDFMFIGNCNYLSECEWYLVNLCNNINIVFYGILPPLKTHYWKPVQIKAKCFQYNYVYYLNISLICNIRQVVDRYLHYLYDKAVTP